jgi:hypothetical protein
MPLLVEEEEADGAAEELVADCADTITAAKRRAEAVC